MTTITSAPEYCDVCKKETLRCEYYPMGRSRQHRKCLECDTRDPKNSVPPQTRDRRYCIECDRNHRAAMPR
jgi:hypothetical protein